MAWIESGAHDSGMVRHILLIRIHDSPPETNRMPDGWHGTFYQAWAPLEAVLNVRTTGQRSHNDNELSLLTNKLCALEGVRLETATFEFSGTNAPLSWHLTGRDKNNLNAEWISQAGSDDVAKVKEFLRTESLKGDPEKYDAAIGCPGPPR